MCKKIGFMAVSLLFIACILCTVPAGASAGCRDDCYTECCGEDPSCGNSEAMSCVADCLRACAGEDLDDVIEPEPDEGGEAVAQ